MGAPPLVWRPGDGKTKDKHARLYRTQDGEGHKAFPHHNKTPSCGGMCGQSINQLGNQGVAGITDGRQRSMPHV